MNPLPRIFEPWKTGEDTRFKGVRLLLVGESHYGEGVNYTPLELAGFTREIVERWGVRNEGYQRFFASAYEVVKGEPWASDNPDVGLFWSEVSFYNYVQELVPGGPGERPKSAAFSASGPAFLQTLEELRPEAVIVFGTQVWQSMPIVGASQVGFIEGLGEVWVYNLLGGDKTHAVHTPHPASRGFQTALYAGPIAAFLAAVRGGSFS
jgi:hypothetical protein